MKALWAGTHERLFLQYIRELEDLDQSSQQDTAFGTDETPTDDNGKESQSDGRISSGGNQILCALSQDQIRRLGSGAAETLEGKHGLWLDK